MDAASSSTGAEGYGNTTRNGGIFSFLSSGFLISPSGDKVDLKEMQGKSVGLYFAANWYWKCETFTPVLHKVYHQLKEEGSGFEVVFVSSDEDQASFDRFHRSMPWLAVPFTDLRSRRYLTQRFQIEGIPSLVVLGPNGELVSADGVELVCRYGARAFPFTSERIAELVEEERLKHSSQTLEMLLSIEGRDYVNNHGKNVKLSNLVGKTVGLYFSAQPCPPCVKFTAKLASVYANLREKNENFEVVFVSMDKNIDDYLQCFDSMPWLALPYDEEFSRALARYFDVQEIPTLVIIGPDGKTVTKEGRNLINLHSELAFPFTELQLRLLQEKQNEEAKAYPSSFDHVGHHHVLNLVSEKSGGGPYMCCECNEQGLGWAYQCLGCGYEIHLKCGREGEEESAGKK
ncbi:putative nucleoredoxin 2 [Ananas comosus]|uniref:protein-disulfide reductase n=1 Tax=Ananas comosus TaxID=4615 RepID=A0A199VAP4_ANACO|nr:putative nucleoredoxin 2 [Ananas comosus]